MFRLAMTTALTGLVGSFFVIETVPAAQAATFCIGVRGVGGCVSTSRKKKTRSNRKRTTRGPRSSHSSRAVVRDDANIQRALNAFGYNAGPPDGAFGPKTRAAIRRYQAAVDASETGNLTAQQRAALLAQYTKLLSAPADRKSPGDGRSSTTVSFLKSLRDQGPSTTDAAAGSITISKLCGDETSEANTTEVNFDLSGVNASALYVEQFCTARSYVLQTLQESLDGAPQLDVADTWRQCDAHAAGRDADLALLRDSDADDFAQTLASDILPQESDREAVLDSSEICLGLSYAFDSADRALLYASYLAVLGDSAHGELIGEQFGLGLGVAQDRDRAAQWLGWTANALDDGAAPLVELEDYDHSPLLRAMANYSGALDSDLAAALTDKPDGKRKAVFMLPGLSGDTAGGDTARDVFVMRKSIAPLELVMDMPFDEMRKLCDRPDEIQSVVALKLCRAVSYAAEDPALMKAYDERL